MCAPQANGGGGTVVGCGTRHDNTHTHRRWPPSIYIRRTANTRTNQPKIVIDIIHFRLYRVVQCSYIMHKIYRYKYILYAIVAVVHNVHLCIDIFFVHMTYDFVVVRGCSVHRTHIPARVCLPAKHMKMNYVHTHNVGRKTYTQIQPCVVVSFIFVVFLVFLMCLFGCYKISGMADFRLCLCVWQYVLTWLTLDDNIFVRIWMTFGCDVAGGRELPTTPMPNWVRRSS